ncbi:farnesoate epoxidase-like [Folsomia candida]|uniref:farnesoate epoxidase-like n=1 Tax=Folsomia candida TaxID=158441 RepID=UPI0016053510|nr:farnesoate epoxidase-like [Folsomia candida]
MIQTFGVLAEKYGEIYTVKMGSKKTVILTSKEAIQTVLSNDASNGRDRSGTFADRCWNKNLGIVTSEGELWEKSKIWTFKTLKELGFGKSFDIENFIRTASESLFSEIDNKMETCGSIGVGLLFNKSILAIMWQMIVGRLSREDEPLIDTLSEKGNKFAQSSLFGAGIVNVFPFLRFVFPNLLGYNMQMDFFNTCNKVAKNSHPNLKKSVLSYEQYEQKQIQNSEVFYQKP